jgi:hypothetical protein
MSALSLSDSKADCKSNPISTRRIPTTRLSALDALSDVPKPVVQMIDDYARRPPPVEVVTALWRDMARTCSRLADKPTPQWSRFLCIQELDAEFAVELMAFDCGSDLRRALSPNAERATRDYRMRKVAPASMTAALKEHGAGALADAVSRFCSVEGDALCTLVSERGHWCAVILAVPDSACDAIADVLQADGSVSLNPLFGLEKGDGLCGLFVDHSLSFTGIFD